MKFDYKKVRGALSEVQTTFRWVVRFLEDTNTDPDIKAKFDEDVEIRCQSLDLPQGSTEHIQVQLQGQTINYVGKENRNGEITLTIVGGADAKDQEALYYWKSKYFSALEGNSVGTEKCKIKVEMDLLDANNEVTRTYTLYGVLPGQIGAGGSLGQDSAALQPTITLSYDNFTWKKKGGEEL